MKASEIDAKAKWYLKDHPELHWAAFERACKMGLIDEADRETLLALMDLARYLSGDSGTDSAKSGTENKGDFLALKG
jgi:hypothetical protein